MAPIAVSNYPKIEPSKSPISKELDLIPIFSSPLIESSGKIAHSYQSMIPLQKISFPLLSRDLMARYFVMGKPPQVRPTHVLGPK